jgi:hypothetical protein
VFRRSPEAGWRWGKESDGGAIQRFVRTLCFNFLPMAGERLTQPPYDRRRRKPGGSRKRLPNDSDNLTRIARTNTRFDLIEERSSLRFRNILQKGQAPEKGEAEPRIVFQVGCATDYVRTDPRAREAANPDRERDCGQSEDSPRPSGGRDQGVAERQEEDQNEVRVASEDGGEKGEAEQDPRSSRRLTGVIQQPQAGRDYEQQADQAQTF